MRDKLVTKVSTLPVLIGSPSKSKTHPENSVTPALPVTNHVDPNEATTGDVDPENTLVDVGEDELSMAQPPRKKAKLSMASFSTLPSPPLKIIVGTEEKKQVLYIKKESICPKSKSIQELCSRKKDLTKDKTQLVLVDVIKQPEVFVVFLVWVVTGDINRAEGLTELVPFENESYPFKHAPGGAEALKKTFGELVQCWILGFRLQAEEFQNVVIDKLLELMRLQYLSVNEGGTRNTCSNIQLVNQIYQQTPSHSPLRLLILDYYATSVHAKTFVMNTCKNTEVEREFLDELLMCTMRWVQDKKYQRKLPWERGEGYYHCVIGKVTKVVKRERG